MNRRKLLTERPIYEPTQDYPADSFLGTAQYYARYRPPYPQELIDDLRRRSGITGDGRLLDLGCGPGRVALLLSPYFSEVWAVDQESEMIEVGRQEAEQRGATNIQWMVGRAEDLEAQSESFDLITIGEAFHRLDQRLVAKLALEWLMPGGCLATMGCYGVFNGKEKWQILGAEVVRKWTGSRPPTKSKKKDQPRGPDHDQEILRAAGFEEVEIYKFPIPHVWTLDSIIGFQYSTSVTSKRALGEDTGKFEADLRGTLLTYDSRGEYSATLSCGYTLARRPSP